MVNAKEGFISIWESFRSHQENLPNPDPLPTRLENSEMPETCTNFRNKSSAINMSLPTRKCMERSEKVQKQAARRRHHPSLTVSSAGLHL